MKKILIIGFTKIKYMPYLNLYKNIINSNKTQVTLLYWDRDTSEDISIHKNLKLVKFQQQQQDQTYKLFKVINFIKFKMFVKKEINRNEYDFIIVLSTLPAFLISNLLINKYKKRYVFDYRDVTLENIPFFKNKIKHIMDNACLVVSSSRGFEKLYPNVEMSIVHNTDFLTESIINSEYDFNTPIKITFLGFIRQYKYNIKVINMFKNDPKFQLHYYGRKQKVAILLEKYVEKHKINNVFFHGEYTYIDKKVIFENTNIINNLYDNDFPTTFAMGNKFYDGIKFKIPQICNLNSFMGKVVEENNLGLQIDLDAKHSKDKILEYCKNFDKERFIKSTDEMELEVSRDNIQVQNKLIEILRGAGE